MSLFPSSALAAPSAAGGCQHGFKRIIASVRPLGPATPGISTTTARIPLEVAFANGLKLTSDPTRQKVTVAFPMGATIPLERATLEVSAGSVKLARTQKYRDAYGQARRKGLEQVIKDEAACHPPKEHPRLVSTQLWLMSFQSFDAALDYDEEPLEVVKGPYVVVSLRGEADTWGDLGAVREGSSGDYCLFSGDMIFPLVYRRWLLSPHPTPGFPHAFGPEVQRRVAATLRSAQLP